MAFKISNIIWLYLVDLCWHFFVILSQDKIIFLYWSRSNNPGTPSSRDRTNWELIYICILAIVQGVPHLHENHKHGFHYQDCWLIFFQGGDFQVSRRPPTVPHEFHLTQFFPSSKMRVRWGPSVHWKLWITNIVFNSGNICSEWCHIAVKNH